MEQYIMICGLCGCQLVHTRNSYLFESNILGQVIVPNIEQVVCSGCRDVTLPPGSAQEVFEYISSETQKAISHLPVGMFVPASEAAELLGISKQAFSKNKRIRRGFIYSLDISGHLFYYRPSVISFEETGDGRVALNVCEEPNQQELDIQNVYGAQIGSHSLFSIKKKTKGEVYVISIKSPVRTRAQDTNDNLPSPFSIEGEIEGNYNMPSYFKNTSGVTH